MIRLGHVYGNLMVNVQPTNRKLEDRARRVIQKATGVSYEAATALLEHETLSGVALDAVLSTVHEVNLEELRDVRRASSPRFTVRDPKDGR